MSRFWILPMMPLGRVPESGRDGLWLGPFCRQDTRHVFRIVA